MLSMGVNKALDFFAQHYSWLFIIAIFFAIVAVAALLTQKKLDVYSLAWLIASLIFAIIGISGINYDNSIVTFEDGISSNNSASSNIDKSSDRSSESDNPSDLDISNESGTADLSNKRDNEDNETEDNETHNEDDKSPIEYGTPFVTVSPQNKITIGNLVRWDTENDRDIFGNTYDSAMKLTAYNFVDAIGGGHSNITADVHMPLGGKADFSFIVSFVVAADMRGNGSSAEVTILADSEELYPPFIIDSTSTDRMEYTIDPYDIWDLVFHFECDSVDNGFCVGIVLEDAPEE